MVGQSRGWQMNDSRGEKAASQGHNSLAQLCRVPSIPLREWLWRFLVTNRSSSYMYLKWWCCRFLVTTLCCRLCSCIYVCPPSMPWRVWAATIEMSNLCDEAIQMWLTIWCWFSWKEHSKSYGHKMLFLGLVVIVGCAIRSRRIPFDRCTLLPLARPSSQVATINGKDLAKSTCTLLPPVKPSNDNHKWQKTWEWVEEIPINFAWGFSRSGN